MQGGGEAAAGQIVLGAQGVQEGRDICIGEAEGFAEGGCGDASTEAGGGA